MQSGNNGDIKSLQSGNNGDIKSLQSGNNGDIEWTAEKLLAGNGQINFILQNFLSKIFTADYWLWNVIYLHIKPATVFVVCI